MLSLGQHCRRGIEKGHLVARPGQREGLMARPAPYVQDGRRRTGEVVQELVMKHVGTDLSLYRRVRLLHELVGQSCPRVAVHGNPSWHRPRIARGIGVGRGTPWYCEGRMTSERLPGDGSAWGCPRLRQHVVGPGAA